jgi:carboxymethylenebutenolidase
MMAVKVPTLSAAVPYYGGQPTAQEAEQITTPLLLHYAGLDSRVNEGWPAMKLYLEQYRKHRFYLSWVNHGFHNNTTPRYDEPSYSIMESNNRFF